MNRRIINGLIVICVTLCLPCTVISAIAGGGFVNEIFAEPANVNIEVNAPRTVTEGESFTIEVQVKNLADQPQVLDSIDIQTDYLDMIAIHETRPSFTTYTDWEDFRSYVFGQDIQPNESVMVQFSAVAVKAGAFSGDIQVCLNSWFSCQSCPLRTSIVE